MTELIDGKEYIIENDDFLCFATYHVGKSGSYFQEMENQDIIYKSECHQIIPLELAVRAEELQSENERLRNALETLLDVQNGPPLVRDADRWQEAVGILCRVAVERR